MAVVGIIRFSFYHLAF